MLSPEFQKEERVARLVGIARRAIEAAEEVYPTNKDSEQRDYDSQNAMVLALIQAEAALLAAEIVGLRLPGQEGG